jgi:hypothetical protein
MIAREIISIIVKNPLTGDFFDIEAFSQNVTAILPEPKGWPNL